MTTSRKILLGLMLIGLAAIAGLYLFPKKSVAPPEAPAQNAVNTTGNSEPAAPPNQEEALTLTLMVPRDLAEYKRQMAEFVQAGGPDPLETAVFVEKQISVASAEDRMKASAQAAAEQIPTGGGPEKVTVEYFKVQDGTAYVLLNIDLDGWAGVSVALASIHPLVEKTLLRFPEIEKVVFGYAPEEK